MKPEIISRVPQGRARPTPLLFVHGAFVGAWCWDEYFLAYFAERGYAAHAVSLRGHGGSPGQETLAVTGVDDYVADMLFAAEQFKRPPVLIGHSMGGIVVQRGLKRSNAPAAVLMASVPPQGLMGSAFLLAAQNPQLFREINLIQHARPRHATPEGMRKALFSETMAEDEVLKHCMRMQPESQRALFDLSWPQYFWIGDTRNEPVLVLGAGNDAFFPPFMTEATARLHGTEAVIFSGMAHAMMLEPAWRSVADRIALWLGGQGL
ncbi:MAG: alpha/beta hydrolase [Pseudomonadota bacterium]